MADMHILIKHRIVHGRQQDIPTAVSSDVAKLQEEASRRCPGFNVNWVADWDDLIWSVNHEISFSIEPIEAL